MERKMMSAGRDTGPPVRCGVVGCGRVFLAYHLPCLTDRSDMVIGAVCDPDTDRVAEALNGIGGEVLVTSSLDEFFDEGGLDVVLVCSPNDAHAEPVLEAIARDAAVLCEKPLAADLDQSRIMATAAAIATQPVGVNLPYRFHDLLPRFSAVVQQGGFELVVDFHTFGPRLWRPVTDWYGRHGRAGGGALIDLGPHVLDLLIVLLGKPEVIDCRMDRAKMEEKAEFRLRFGDIPVRVHIDRQSRRPRFLITARDGQRFAELDLRQGRLRTDDGVYQSAERRPELGAIHRFLDAAAGLDAAVVPMAEALLIEEVIAGLYGCSQTGTKSE